MSTISPSGCRCETDLGELSPWSGISCWSRKLHKASGAYFVWQHWARGFGQDCILQYQDPREGTMEKYGFFLW